MTVGGDLIQQPLTRTWQWPTTETTEGNNWKPTFSDRSKWFEEIGLQTSRRLHDCFIMLNHVQLWGSLMWACIWYRFKFYKETIQLFKPYLENFKCVFFFNSLWILVLLIKRSFFKRLNTMSHKRTSSTAYNCKTFRMCLSFEDSYSYSDTYQSPSKWVYIWSSSFLLNANQPNLNWLFWPLSSGVTPCMQLLLLQFRL